MGLLALAAVVLTACSDEPEAVYQTSADNRPTLTRYDATLEPSAAVAVLVPTSATRLEVTDFDQIRLTLGVPDVDSSSPEADQVAFLQAVDDSAALSPGLLRPSDGRLREEFGVGAADVAWEATWSGPGGDADAGWVIAFADDVPMDSVRRAVRAGVPPLRGAVVDAERHYVTSAEVVEPEASWGADPDLVALLGREGIATQVARGCAEPRDVYGEAAVSDLAPSPAAAVDALEPLDGYAVVMGSQLATVQLGPDRGDFFSRLRLADVLPRTEPEFGSVFSRGVADPSTGRLGYDLLRPPAGADLVRAGILPFAICAD